MTISGNRVDLNTSPPVLNPEDFFGFTFTLGTLVDVAGVATFGQFVYTASPGDDTVAVFRDIGGGQLELRQVFQDGVGGMDYLDGASHVAVSDDGLFVYVSASLDDALTVFRRDAESGLLTLLQEVRDGIGGVDGLKGVVDFALSNNTLSAAGRGDNALAVFTCDSGILVFKEMIRNTPSVNVALGKSASQSATYGNLSYCGADRAVDGNTDPVWHAGSTNSISHTAAMTDPWWQVELGADYVLDHIMLFDRSGYPQQLSNFSVIVSNDGTAVWQSPKISKVSASGGGSRRIDLPAGIVGDRVRIQVEGAGAVLVMAECAVYTRDGSELTGINSVTVSDDGTRLYTTADNGTVAAFARNASGELSFLYNIGGPFPTTLAHNGSNFLDATFTGPSDDVDGRNLPAGSVITYDFGGNLVGPQGYFNVYEVDWGVAEFEKIKVEISADGSTWQNVTPTAGAAERIPGDELHGDLSFARSYATGAVAARYVRITAVTAGFDLDAVGIAGVPRALGVAEVVEGGRRILYVLPAGSSTLQRFDVSSDGRNVNLDLSSAFNADMVTNGSGVIDANQDGWGVERYSFITQSAAAQLGGTAGNGLPDNGLIVGSAVDFPVQLGYRNNDDGKNAIRLTGGQRAFITLEAADQAHYEKLHLFGASCYGNAAIEVGLCYSDGSVAYQTVTVHDWYEDSLPSGTFPIINGLDRHYSGGWQNVNDPAIFAIPLTTDATRLLTGIEITQTTFGNPSACIFGTAGTARLGYSSLGSVNPGVSGLRAIEAIAGQSIYLLGQNTVAACKVDPATFSLGVIDTALLGAGASPVGLHVTEDKVYVADPGTDSLHVFGRDFAVSPQPSDTLFANGELLTTFRNPSPYTADQFGQFVTMSGDIIAVGVPADDNSGAADTGAVHLFDARTGQLFRTLLNPSPGLEDGFGHSVAISGNIIVVGVPRAHEPGYADSGEVRIYDATDESVHVRIPNETVAAWDVFGFSVAVSGDIVAVGAPYADYGGADNPGAVYVYRRNTSTGQYDHLSTLVRPTGAQGSALFGWSVAMSGDYIVVGAPYVNEGATDSGAAYVYKRNVQGQYIAHQTLYNPSPAAGDLFGYSMAMSSDRLVVGAPLADIGAIVDAGEAQVYELADGQYVRRLTLQTPSPAGGDQLGIAVAISGDKIVAGAYGTDRGGRTDAGAAYVFDAPTGSLLSALGESAPQTSSRFGNSVAISGDTVVVGAFTADDSGAADCGLVYTFATASQRAAVATGDLDHDGIADLVTANSSASTVSVLLGEGHGTFQPAVNFAAGAGPSAVVLVDLNGDGHLDIVTANSDSDSVSLLWGNGDGTFQPPVHFDVGDGPCSVVVADLDGDGFLDLITANFHSDNVSVLRGNGNGTFQAAQYFAAGDGPCSVVVADLDDDGLLDLITANFHSDNVSVLRGNGNGTFQAARYFAAGEGPRSVAAADLNEDGVLDLVAANFHSDDVSVLLGTGHGMFLPKTDFAAGDGPSSIAVARLPGDGHLDVITANFNSDNFSVLLGNGDGALATPVSFAAGDGPRSVAVVDLNGDALLDFVSANQLSRNVSVRLAEPSFGSVVTTTAASARMAQLLPNSGLQSVAVTPDGKFAYAVNPAADALVALRVDVQGTLSFIESYIDGGDSQAGLVDGLKNASQVVVNPVFNELYVLSPGEPALSVFRRDPVTGKLTLLQKLTSTGATGLAVSPDGQKVCFTYTISDTANLGIRTRQADGSLTTSYSVWGIAGANDWAIKSAGPSPDATVIFLASNSLDQVRVFMHSSAGLSFVQDISGIVDPSGVALSPDGQTLSITSASDNSLRIFVRQPVGSFSLSQTFREGEAGVRGIGGASGVAATSSSILVAGTEDDALAVFVRNAVTGEYQFQQVCHTRGDVWLESPNSVAAALDGTVFVGTSEGLAGRNGGIAVFKPFVAASTQSAVSFENIEALAVQAGSGSDTFIIDGPSVTYPVTIDGGEPGDADCLIFDPQGYSTDPAVGGAVPDSQQSIYLLDGGTPYGPTHSFKNVEYLKILSRPSVAAGLDQTAEEGSTVNLGPATFTDRGGAADTHTAQIDWGDGTVEPGQVNQAAGTVSGSHVYADNGFYTVTVTVTDSDGLSASDTLTVTVLNVAPSLALSGAASVDEGAVYTLHLSSSDPGPDTIGSWTVNWGDGSIEAIPGNPVSWTHIYADGPQSHTISATAADEDGSYAAGNTVPITVLNVAPIATITTITQPRIVGQAITVTGSAADPAGTHDTLSYAWKVFKDGGATASFEGSGIDWSFTPGASGSYRIELNVSDEDGGSTAVEQTIEVVDIRETLAISGAATVDEMATYTLGLSSSDPTVAISSWTISWGDGAPETVIGTPATVTHVYTDGPRDYTISATATSQHGTHAAGNTVSVSVINLAPRDVAITGPATGYEGTPIVVIGSAIDPAGAHDTLSYAWTVKKDGAEFVTGTGENFSFTPDDQAIYTVELIVSDEDGGSTAATSPATIAVANLPPSDVTITAPTSGDKGVPITLIGSATDPAGANDTLSFAWTVNKDGAEFVTGTGASFTFTPDQKAVYTFELEVSDEDGGKLVVTMTEPITVFDNVPTALLATPQPAAPGQPILLDASGSSHDRPDRSIVSYTWNFGDGTTYSESPGAAPDGLFDGKTNHTYALFGSYTVTLTVADSNVPPKTATASTVALVNQGNNPPLALPGGPYIVDLGNGVTLDGSGSYDPDSAAGDSIANYDWDLSGDGVYELTGVSPAVLWAVLESLLNVAPIGPPEGSADGPTILGEGPSSFALGEPIPLHLRVTDTLGATGTAATSITIFDNRPFAVLTADPEQTATGQPVVLDGSGSWHGRPIDRSLVSYTWDFGDGTTYTETVGSAADGLFDGKTVHAYALFGSYTVTLTVADNNLPAKTATASTTVIVNQGNQLPVAGDDAYTILEDTLLEVPAPGVLGNDSDAENNPLTVEWLSLPLHGDRVFSNDAGRFSYQPHANYHGPDSFTYRVSDGSGWSNVATVNITVEPVNDVPTVEDCSYTLDQNAAWNASLSVAAPGLLANDWDIDGDPLAVVWTSNPSNGTVAFGADGSFTYTPAVGFCGTAGFTYRVSDGTVESSAATVTITVNPGPDTAAPSSRVNPLAAKQTSLTFPVTVSGTDPFPGTGIASYDIFVSRDQAAFTLWQTVPVTDPTAMFTAESGHIYGFRSLARDAAGNVESKPIASDAWTQVPDLDAPETQVTGFAVHADTATIRLEFSGTDLGGSGLDSFNLYVAIDGGAMTLAGTYVAGNPTSGVYTGSAVFGNVITDGQEHSYRFFTAGIDGQGNTEPAASALSDVLVTVSFSTPSMLAVTGFDVQKNATQRSYIRYLDVFFNQPDGVQGIIDSLDSGTGRIALTRYDLSGENPISVPLTAATLSARAVDLALEIDFGPNGIGGNPNGLEGNGYYRLSIDADNDVAHTLETDLYFYRLAGDVNLDGRIDSLDLMALNALLAATPYDVNRDGIIDARDWVDADVNGDGLVNSSDRLLVMRGRNKVLATGLHLTD